MTVMVIVFWTCGIQKNGHGIVFAKAGIFWRIFGAFPKNPLP